MALGAFPPNVTLSLAIPNNPTLSGLVVHFQALVLDPRLPELGVATSNLLSMRVGR